MEISCNINSNRKVELGKMKIVQGEKEESVKMLRNGEAKAEGKNFCSQNVYFRILK